MATNENAKMFSYFFMSLAASCSLVTILPGISTQPNNLLFCYFFIIFSAIGLFISWYMQSKDDGEKTRNIYFLLPPLVFIFFSVLSCFTIISINGEVIQKGNINNFYYKFNIVTTLLIVLEFYIYYTISRRIQSKSDNKPLLMYNITLTSISFLIIFIAISNSIGLTSFIVDG